TNTQLAPLASGSSARDPIVNPQSGILGVLPAQMVAQAATTQPTAVASVSPQLAGAAPQQIGPPQALQTTTQKPALNGPSTGPAVQTNTTSTATTTEPTAQPLRTHSGWMIQVGALDAEDEAKARLDAAQSKAKNLLGRAERFTEPVVQGNKTYYRAR